MFCHQHYKKKILFLEIVKKDFQTFWYQKSFQKNFGNLLNVY
jgi:hypothetical protein